MSSIFERAERRLPIFILKKLPVEEAAQCWVSSSCSIRSVSAGSSSEEGNARSLHLCDLCRRTFQSDKALHGHMKVHNSRSWRGMVPTVKESSENSLAMMTEVDFLRPWVSCRRKRFRRIREATGVGNGGGEIRDEVVEKKETSKFFTKDECDVADGLILLSNSEPAQEAPPPPPPPPPPPVEREEGEEGFGSQARKKKQKDLPMSKRQHACNICHASFATGQALGGHMSCHYRPRLPRHIPCPSSGVGSPANPFLEVSVTPVPVESSSSLVVFERGARAAMAMDMVSRNVLDIDLNLIPQE